MDIIARHIPYHENHRRNFCGEIEKKCNWHDIFFPDEDPWMLATLDNFYKNNKSPDGLFPYCKECDKIKSTIWIKEHPERYKELRSKHFETDKFKLWQKKNQIQMKEFLQQWRRDNPEKIKEYNNNRKTTKKHDITEQELQILYEYANYSCMYCGMSENYNKHLYNQRLHKDHAINEGSNEIDNCILACKECSSSKRDKDWDVWYVQENPVYSEDNYKLIVNWLNNSTT